MPLFSEPLEQRRHLHSAPDFTAAVNFQPLDVPRPPQMVIDYGSTYDARRGGMTYGWSEDRTAQTVDRNVTRVQRNDTFIRMNGATWEMAVANGSYTVYAVAGDPAQVGIRIAVEVEGTIALAAVTKARKPFLEASVTVAVTDGKLSVKSLGSTDLLSYLGISGTTHHEEPAPAPEEPQSPTQPLGDLSWLTRKSLTVPRVEGMSTAVGGQLYVFGGYLDNTWAPTARVDRYDPKTNSWQQMNNMPERTSHAGTTTDGQYIYFAGGYPGLSGNRQAFASTAVRRYDPISDTYTNLKPLPQARGGGELYYIAGKLYFVAGSDVNRADHDDHWMLDLTVSNANWVTRASLPQNRNHFGGGVINGKIYIVGGQTGQETTVVFKNDVWSYDPATNAWTTLASVPNPVRSHQTAATFVHKGNIISLGGETYGSAPGKPSALRSSILYNPVTNVWSTLTSLPGARSTGFANSLGDAIVYSAGYNGATFHTTTWVGVFAT